MISKKGKFIFVPVRIVAGKSITAAFSEYCSRVLNEDIKKSGGFDTFNRGVLSNGGKYGNWYKEIPKYKDYHIFTVVRNPWDRIISGYFYSKKGQTFLGRKTSLKEFLNNLPTKESNYRWWFHLTRTLTEMLIDKNGNYIADSTMRHESLTEDLKLLCEKLNIENVTLPDIGIVKHKNYTEYYDSITRELVANRYKEDIKYFGYKFGE